MNVKLVIFRGVPGSGKSTAAKEYAKKHKMLHFEADMFFYRNGVYNFDSAKLNAAHAWCRTQVVKELRNGNSVVVSNTFTKYWELEPYLVDIFMLDDVDIKVDVYHCKKEYGNVHGVPEDKMVVMRNRFESNERIIQQLGLDKDNPLIKFFEVE